MSKTIKTREVKKDIKLLDKSAVLAQKVKNTAVKAKAESEEITNSKHSSPDAYAVNTVEEKGRQIVNKTGQQVKKQGDKVIYRVKERRYASKIKPKENTNLENINENILGKKKAKSKSNTRYDKSKKSESIKNSKKIPVKTSTSVAKNKAKVKFANDNKSKNIKTKPTQNAIKGTKKAIKTAQNTGKAVAKTTKQTVKTVKHTAKATAKTAQQTAKVAKTTAKTAAQTVKLLAKATAAAIKATAAALKSLISAIIAGGWIAVVVILIIAVIAVICASVYGIFFVNENTENAITMQEIITEINNDYIEKIEKIKKDNPHDDLIITGTRASWKDILAVYAVKVTTDPDNPMEVATLDDNKKEILKNIFWDMNKITHKIEKKKVIEETRPTEENSTQPVKEKTIKVLNITINRKTAEDIALQYRFNSEQKKQLSILYDANLDKMWSNLLYGSGMGDSNIVEVALEQVGNGGTKYWSWYGFDGRVEWCACFVSWCANECGYIQSGIIPKFAACTSEGMAWFKAHGQWQERGYIPKTGDIIFFDWDNSGNCDHVGIVEKVENSIVYTIEGNARDQVKRLSYSVNSEVISGYGVPLY